MLKFGRSSRRIVFSISGFRWISQYTTSSTAAVSSNFTADYLVNSVGFSKEEAVVASSKVSILKSLEKADSVVKLLKSSGFNHTQIKTIISSVPKILTYDAHKTLKPKLEAFLVLGLRGSELADVISHHPHIFIRGLSKHIAPTLEVLKCVCGDNSILLEALKKSSWMLAPAIPRIVPANVALLKSYGLSIDQIKWIFLRKTRYFVLDPKWLQGILVRVEEKIGIPRTARMFLHGVCAIGGMSEESLELKFKMFKSFGWGESDILTLARRNPRTLALSESRIRHSLKFLMKDLGHQPEDIASCPCLLTVSLEKRVIPRYVVVKVLKEKGLIKPGYRFISCLVLREERFLERFVLPFKEVVFDLYTDHMRRVGSALKTAR